MIFQYFYNSLNVVRMFSKNKKSEEFDHEQRLQYEYARKRIVQKKRLMQHFIIFLAGSVLLIIINPVLGIGKDFFIENWFAWAILIWAFLFLVHLLNVFIMSKFMGKEWEDKQLEHLKAKQTKRIAELQKQVDSELLQKAPEVKKNDPNPQNPEYE